MQATSLKGTHMKEEVKDGVPLMPFPKNLPVWQLPSLVKKSALTQVQTDRVASSMKVAYARIEKQRASIAQKDNANHDTAN